MAVGIVEKGNSGLFDNEIEFNGNMQLWSDSSRKI